MKIDNLLGLIGIIVIFLIMLLSKAPVTEVFDIENYEEIIKRIGEKPK